MWQSLFASMPRTDKFNQPTGMWIWTQHVWYESIKATFNFLNLNICELKSNTYIIELDILDTFRDQGKCDQLHINQRGMCIVCYNGSDDCYRLAVSKIHHEQNVYIYSNRILDLPDNLYYGQPKNETICQKFLPWIDWHPVLGKKKRSIEQNGNMEKECCWSWAFDPFFSLKFVYYKLISVFNVV